MLSSQEAYLALIGDPTPDVMLDRYDAMLATLTSEIRNRAGEDESAPEHLRWMIQQMRSSMEPLQASRWLGWIHKGLCDLGLTTSLTERNFTRPYFKPIRETWATMTQENGK